MTAEVYTLLWTAYLAFAGLAFVLFWDMTRFNGRLKFFSGLSRVLFVAVVATPANLSTTPDFMAPALVVALLDYLQGYEDGAFDAAINLGIAGVGAMIAYTVYSFILLIVRSRKKKQSTGYSHPEKIE